jgi:hypothetical protein
MLIYGMVKKKCKLILIMDIKELSQIYNKLSNEDLINIFEMSSDRIFVWSPHDKTCYDLDNDVPFCFNGPRIQINIEDIFLKPMVTKE